MYDGDNTLVLPLISDDIVPLPPGGPKYTQVYRRPNDFDFSDILASLEGPPHKVFDAFRAHAPVAWQDVKSERGFWVITRHEDVRHVSRNSQIFSSQKGGIVQLVTPPELGIPRLRDAAFNSMITMDGGWHQQMRSDHQMHFTKDAVQLLTQKIEAKSRELIDAFPKSGHCNLVEQYSQELPLFTLSELLGIEEADRPKLVRWMHYLEIASYLVTLLNSSEEEFPSWAPTVEPDFYEKLLESVQEMFDYGEYQLKKRRESRNASDLLSTIAWSQLEESLLSQAYLDGAWLLIVFAGNDTTRNTLSGTMKLLTEYPQEREKLMADRSLLDGMVEEAIRHVSPVQYMARTATQDTEIRGQKIAAGEKVVMYYGAANRDPDLFDDPHRFDIQRSNANRQISFGFGKAPVPRASRCTFAAQNGILAIARSLSRYSLGW